MRLSRLLLVVLLATPVARAASVPVTAMAPATMTELSQTDVAPSTAVHIHRRSHSSMIGEVMIPDVFTPAPEAIAAPPVTTRFQDDIDSEFRYPADAGGAVSASYVVSVNNNAVSVRDRSGKQIIRTRIGQFWHDPNFPDGNSYDTRISYDVHANRFVIAALNDQGPGNQSTLLFAATATGDPTGTWYRYRLRVDPSNINSADFTRLALAASQAIITANIYVGSAPDPSFASVYTVPLASLYVGATAPTATAANTPTNVVDVAPVAVMDANDASVWIVATTSAGLTAYDVAHSFASVLHKTAPIATVDAFTTTYGSQLGSSYKLDTGDMVPQNSVIRDHVLWAVQTAQPAVGAVRTIIAMWRIDLGTNALRYLTVDDGTGATMYGFPSMAVNRNGAALLAYAQYNAAYFVSAAYTYVDPAGNASASTFLQQGAGVYQQDRWDDFTTTVVDPADDTGFWTVQQLPLKSQSIWSTWWFQVPLTVTPAKHRAARH